MAFTRITDTDLQGKGVIGQPEIPGLSALEMQQSVEQIVREVAIPGINRLAEELEADTGAAGIGMERPAGMSEEVPAHVQAITAAHIEDRENPHAVTAAQVGAYTKQETVAAINNKVVEIGAGDMAQAIYAVNGEPGVVDTAVQARAADDGVKLYTHTRSGKVHMFTGSGPNGRALMTADVQAGDTFAVNGKTVSAWMGTESAVAVMEGQPYTGRWVTFVTEGDTLNFKGGGGLVTVEGLSADVLLGGSTVTVKQGAKVIASIEGTAIGFLAEGGTTKWGNGTYQLGTYPPGRYRIILRTFQWTSGETSNTVMRAGSTAILSLSASGSSGNTRSSKDFDTAEELAFTVENGGYSGGCTYVLLKLSPVVE